jgi:hypothetical protein
MRRSALIALSVLTVTALGGDGTAAVQRATIAADGTATTTTKKRGKRKRRRNACLRNTACDACMSDGCTWCDSWRICSKDTWGRCGHVHDNFQTGCPSTRLGSGDELRRYAEDPATAELRSDLGPWASNVSELERISAALHRRELVSIRSALRHSLASELQAELVEAYRSGAFEPSQGEVDRPANMAAETVQRLRAEAAAVAANATRDASQSGCDSFFRGGTLYDEFAFSRHVRRRTHPTSPASAASSRLSKLLESNAALALLRTLAGQPKLVANPGGTTYDATIFRKGGFIRPFSGSNARCLCLLVSPAQH